jgi:hypothetical protein
MENRVYRAEDGRFIAFWRGDVVYKFDGTLRYFENEEAALNFLARRDAVGSSIVGMRRINRTEIART